MSKKNGTGINPETMLRGDRETRKNQLLGKVEAGPKTEEKGPNTKEEQSTWNIDLPLKPKKKSYTQVRVEDPIIIGLKEFIRKNKFDISYTSIINTVTKKYLEQNGIIIKE